MNFTRAQAARSNHALIMVIRISYKLLDVRPDITKASTYKLNMMLALVANIPSRPTM